MIQIQMKNTDGKIEKVQTNLSLMKAKAEYSKMGCTDIKPAEVKAPAKKKGK